MENYDNAEVDEELKKMGNAMRSLFTSLGLLNIILYDNAKDSVNFSRTDWRVIQDVNKIREALDKQISKGAEEFVIVTSNHWVGSFTRK